MDRRIHLKIKIKSLAEEAKIIRHEIKQVQKRIKDMKSRIQVTGSLTCHKKLVVGHEARHSLLAYGLLRGRPYQVIEKSCKQLPSFKKVEELARRFGANHDKICRWISEAKKYLKK